MTVSVDSAGRTSMLERLPAHIENQVTTELLCEMNPDVKGDYVQGDITSQIRKGAAAAEALYDEGFCRLVCIGEPGLYVLNGRYA